MSEQEDQIQGLLDREAIRDLPKRYCDRVWHNDAKGLSELFAADGVFIAVTTDKEIEIKGRNNILDFMREGLADGPRPYIHNHVVELNGPSRASGRAYLDLRSAKHNYDWLGAGYYEDDYEKLAGQWLFKRRVFHALRIDEWPGDIDKTSA